MNEINNHATMPNPGLLADKKALIQSSLKAGLSLVAVAKLTNVSYNTIYIYHRNLQDFRKLISSKLAKLRSTKVMFIYIKDISK